MYLNYILAAFSENSIKVWIIIVSGIGVAFTALVLIYLFIKFVLPSVSETLAGLKTRKEIGSGTRPAKSQKQEGGAIAAIAVVLYLHFSEMHDEESNVITIKRVSRTYSPWSSKLYSMRNRNYK
jgi:hypothetical protein